VAEMLAYSTAKYYSKNNNVIVISTKPQPGLKKTQEDNTTIYRFRPKNIFYYLEDFKYPTFIRYIWRFIDIFNYNSYKTIKKILLKESPDIVITHNLVGIGYLIPKLIKKLKIKHIHTLHDVQLIEASGLKFSEKISFINKLYSKITKFLFNSPDIIISPSNFLLKYYTQQNFFKNSKQIVIQNPIQNNLTITYNAKEKNNDFVRYLYVGQIEKHKGIENLVNAFTEWKEKNAKLLIIGKGSYLKELKKITKNNNLIQAIGFVENSKIHKYIQKSDYTIIPSICYENSPNVIYESFAYGTPILASNIGGIAELVNNKNGFLFNPHKKDEIIHSLNLSNKKSVTEYKELSNNAIKTIKDLTLENYLSKINLNI
jgi:glycosyltransferase involved in cell wall biosynthesis